MMKKFAALFVVCALLCAALPAAWADSYYTGAYGSMTSMTGMTGMTGAYGTVVPSTVYGGSCFKEFTGYINGYRINVRSCPGTSAAVCGVVSYGDVIHVTNQTYCSGNKLWYYGSIDSLCGWIYSGYVDGAPLPTCQTPVTH